MSDNLVLNKKKQIELRVCQQFVKYFNRKYKKRYLEPELIPESEEAPDCVTSDALNPKIKHHFEITEATPDEAKNMGKDCEHEFLSEVRDEQSEYLKQAFALYSLLESRKAMKYPTLFKSQLIILLKGANIEYYDGDIETLSSKVYTDRPWQEKFRNLGFKEVWYVSTRDLFKFYPL